ncbi:hypothetical protein QE438_002774 [Pseudoxanthomonas sp. SORGH_AS 997]|uniref:Uncharacterized protein n=1 Tax=Pseudoxanthomonas winnipegensis TaxID=2480810 RepID=A0AAW8GFK3_9GAMM|nr:hypothetical protein [Pseudoxanthomonas winnipegensis]MDR6139470.1 hypothetical protein [Pseudoxanthomonas sp. SORGH_AS_0997]
MLLFRIRQGHIAPACRPEPPRALLVERSLLRCLSTRSWGKPQRSELRSTGVGPMLPFGIRQGRIAPACRPEPRRALLVERSLLRCLSTRSWGKPQRSELRSTGVGRVLPFGTRQGRIASACRPAPRRALLVERSLLRCLSTRSSGKPQRSELRSTSVGPMLPFGIRQGRIASARRPEPRHALLVERSLLRCLSTGSSGKPQRSELRCLSTRSSGKPQRSELRSTGVGPMLFSAFRKDASPPRCDPSNTRRTKSAPRVAATAPMRRNRGLRVRARRARAAVPVPGRRLPRPAMEQT